MGGLFIEEIGNMNLKKRLLDIKYKLKEGYVGSCWKSVDIINEIFDTKKPNDKFILSAGHLARALYVVLEDRKLITPIQAETLSGHPDRNEKLGIYCSSGSLGHGLPIALGIALSDRSKNVYCLITDGECAEGSIWETLEIRKEEMAFNLKIYVDINGFSAYREINDIDLINRLSHYQPNIFIRPTNCEFFEGLTGHYKVMSDKDYESIVRKYSL